MEGDFSLGWAHAWFALKGSSGKENSVGVVTSLTSDVHSPVFLCVPHTDSTAAAIVKGLKCSQNQFLTSYVCET